MVLSKAMLVPCLVCCFNVVKLRWFWSFQKLGFSPLVPYLGENSIDIICKGREPWKRAKRESNESLLKGFCQIVGVYTTNMKWGGNQEHAWQKNSHNRKRTARIADFHGGYAIKSETNREVDTVAKMCLGVMANNGGQKDMGKHGRAENLKFEWSSSWIESGTVQKIS